MTDEEFNEPYYFGKRSVKGFIEDWAKNNPKKMFLAKALANYTVDSLLEKFWKIDLKPRSLDTFTLKSSDFQKLIKMVITHCKPTNERTFTLSKTCLRNEEMEKITMFAKNSAKSMIDMGLSTAEVQRQGLIIGEPIFENPNVDGIRKNRVESLEVQKDGGSVVIATGSSNIVGQLDIEQSCFSSEKKHFLEIELTVKIWKFSSLTELENFIRKVISAGINYNQFKAEFPSFN